MTNTQSNKNFSVGFIGAGNMARSIIGGLVADKALELTILASDPSTDKLTELKNTFAVEIAESNQTLIEQCDVVVLAVKPQSIHKVLTEVDASQSNAMFLSIAAGVTIKTIAKCLQTPKAIVRTMPNTPALVQCGATGLYANGHVSAQQKNYADTIMNAIGIALWVESEDLLDSVTALSGSGPAYYFLVMEAMQQAAEKLGLSSDIARQLTIQTALGSARLAADSDEAPAQLRQRVTSPGGTTEQAINTFQDLGLVDIFAKAMQAAYDRSQSLAVELEQEST